MAETISRICFSEMMQILREAVSQGRHPGKNLNGREVSKYIKTRYDANNKKGSSVAKVVPTTPTTGIPKKSSKTIWNLRAADHEEAKAIRAKSLPRHFQSDPPAKLPVKKSASMHESTFDCEEVADANVVKTSETTVKEQKEDLLKERNLRRHAQSMFQNISKTLLPSKPSSDVFVIPKEEKAHQLASLGTSRSLDADNWKPRRLDHTFLQLEEAIQENNFKNKFLEAKKLKGLTKRGILYSRLAAKHAVKQASPKPKKSAPKDKAEKPQTSTKAEPKTWPQLKKFEQQANIYKYKSFLNSLPNKGENMARRAREIRAKVIDDFKLVEQRKEIDVLRVMARDILNKHIDDFKEQRKTSLA